MLVILRAKRIINLGLKIIVTIFVVSLIIGHLFNIYQSASTVRGGWLREDKPSGNSMRVENMQKPVQEEDSNILDRFVIQLKGFYQKDE